jgi:hypothetical protein
MVQKDPFIDFNESEVKVGIIVKNSIFSVDFTFLYICHDLKFTIFGKI